MSFLGSKEDAKRYAKDADKQIDSLETTSPIRDGAGEAAGAAPMEGPKEFSNQRTRMRVVGNQGAMKRKLP